jgi:hypothetical protein
MACFKRQVCCWSNKHSTRAEKETSSRCVYGPIPAPLTSIVFERGKSPWCPGDRKYHADVSENYEIEMISSS